MNHIHRALSAKVDTSLSLDNAFIWYIYNSQERTFRFEKSIKYNKYTDQKQFTLLFKCQWKKQWIKAVCDKTLTISNKKGFSFFLNASVVPTFSFISKRFLVALVLSVRDICGALGLFTPNYYTQQCSL